MRNNYKSLSLIRNHLSGHTRDRVSKSMEKLAWKSKTKFNTSRTSFDSRRHSLG